MGGADIHRVVAFGHVADVARTQNFYALLGFEVMSELKGEDGRPSWTYLQAGAGALMFSLADEPVVSEQQAVMFYLYCDDVVGLRQRLLEAGVNVPEITFPPYMQEGEICVQDPDGYTLLIGQAA
jgi:hypothetical protein